MLDEKYVDMLCDILIQHRVISPEDKPKIKAGFAASDKENLDEFLIEEGLAEVEDILKALSSYYKVPPFDATGYFFDLKLLRKFPKDFLLRNAVIPLEVEDGILMVVAADPDQDGLESLLRNYVSYDINFSVGLRLMITDAIKEYYDEAVTEDDYDEDLIREGIAEEDAHRILLSEEEEDL